MRRAPATHMAARVVVPGTSPWEAALHDVLMLSESDAPRLVDVFFPSGPPQCAPHAIVAPLCAPRLLGVAGGVEC